MAELYVDKMAQNIAEKALDDYVYQGRTIREWIDNILKHTWIPVSERLPDDDEMKLVTCKTQKGILNVNRAYYLNGTWHGSGSMSGVIAWMDLPEPYTGEKEE